MSKIRPGDLWTIVDPFDVIENIDKDSEELKKYILVISEGSLGWIQVLDKECVYKIPRTILSGKHSKKISAISDGETVEK